MEIFGGNEVVVMVESCASVHEDCLKLLGKHLIRQFFKNNCIADQFSVTWLSFMVVRSIKFKYSFLDICRREGLRCGELTALVCQDFLSLGAKVWEVGGRKSRSVEGIRYSEDRYLKNLVNYIWHELLWSPAISSGRHPTT